MVETEAHSPDLTVLPTLEHLSINDGDDATFSNINDIILTNNPNLKSITTEGNWTLQRLDLRGSDLHILILY